MLREIIKKNLWLAYRIPVLACGLILLLASIVFPTAGLTAAQASKPIEMMISFVGIIMMTAIFLPEQDQAVRESIACRKIGLESIRIIRMMISIMFLMLFVAAFCLYLKANECEISSYVIWGGMVSAFFMGSIAFCVTGLTGNSINGILAGMVYYICNLGLKKQLGVFFLFRMSCGMFSGKGWLLLGGTLLIATTFIIKKYSLTKQ